MTNPSPRDHVARAIAYFEGCTDADLLRTVLRQIQPKAAAAARKFSNREPPNPAAIPPAEVPASKDEALKTAQTVKDFAHMQAIARAVGRRVEELRSMN
ncbi:MAG: hypothetical protein AB7P33_10055 [Dehalococcoidia bacterium]